MNGAFESEPCAGGRTGDCLRQVAVGTPVRWTNEPYYAPYTLLGTPSWSDYTVAADALLEQAGSVELVGRAQAQNTNNNGLNAYHLRVSDTGAWSILRSDINWNFTTLASGTVASLGTNKWHTIAFKMQGSTLSAIIDGTSAGSATDTTYTNGQAGLGVVGYQSDQFDNFSLIPGTALSGAVTSGIAGKCLNDDSGLTANGTKAEIWDCDGSAAQTWTYTNNGTLTWGGKCLDVTSQGTANGTLVELWDCNGGANQKWTPQSNGTLVSLQSGRCLDDPASSSTNGTQLDIWDCHSGSNQKWTLP
jgi:hypothetical protein